MILEHNILDLALKRKAELPVWSYFDIRVKSASMARKGLPYKPVDSASKIDILTEIFNHKTTFENRVIYIHIPFCKNICNFCGYTRTLIKSETDIENYFLQLEKQIIEISTYHWTQSSPYRAIYFGGGSPSSVPEKYILNTIQLIKQKIPLAPSCEITVESTISDINANFIYQLKHVGVNRISLGVQSFNSELRKKLGRRSGKEKIEEAIETIRNAGIQNICADLIYSQNEQNLNLWEEDLKFLNDSNLTGCSVYPLIHIDNFTKKIISSEIVSDNMEAAYNYFIKADNYLPAIQGWTRFSPVQYGHAENGNAVYVSSHSLNSDILAFGAGAAGRIHNFFYMHTTDIAKYSIQNSNFLSETMIAMQINPDFFNYRTIYQLSEGLKISDSEYQSVKNEFLPTIEKLMQLELVEHKNNHYVLTQSGRFWAGNISSVFSDVIKNVLS